MLTPTNEEGAHTTNASEVRVIEPRVARGTSKVANCISANTSAVSVVYRAFIDI